MSELIKKSCIENNKMYFAVNELINKINSKRYKVIKPLLANVLSTEQLNQLKKEDLQIHRAISEKLNQNPFKNKYMENVGDDSRVDLIEGLKSKGKDFINKFLSNDEEVHASISGKDQNELYGYCIPKIPTIERSKENQEHMQSLYLMLEIS